VTACTLDDVVARARGLVTPGRRRILGLTGAPGAGKSTVAHRIVEALGPATAVLVPMDGFHLADVVLGRLGRRDRKGAHDTFDDAGYAALIARLHAAAPDEVVYAPDFRRDIEEPIGSAIAVPPDVPLVVTEGNYLLLDRDHWPRARALVDEVWYLAPPEEVRLARLVLRHEEFGRSPEAARAWATGTDQRNADLIASTAGRADAVLRVR
jgi:pantothenate kinase